MIIDLPYIKNQKEESMKKFNKVKALCVAEEMQAEKHRASAKVHSTEMTKLQGEYRILEEMEKTMLEVGAMEEEDLAQQNKDKEPGEKGDTEAEEKEPETIKE